jgi:type I restriction enzyme M protein
MSSPASTLVNKVWNYCNLLRDDGVSYGDYVEQLTYLLFLKMDYERTRPPYKHKSTIPEDYNWATLVELDGIPLERHYRNTLENFGKEPGILGIVFRKAQNKIQNPAHLRRLIVDLIDKDPWSALSADVKGDIYEGLLEKNAQDTKSGAGQYFTPRVLIDAIVSVMRPQPGTTIIDPAAGTGGFLLSAAGYIANVLFFDRKPASETPWTRTLWIYDLRTNKHFTLKTNTLTRPDLDDFVRCYNSVNRHQRTETECDLKDNLAGSKP